MKSFFLILAAPAIGTLGQIFLKLGMNQIGEITLTEIKNNPLSLILSIISNPWILIAIPLYTGGWMEKESIVTSIKPTNKLWNTYSSSNNTQNV